MYSFEEKTDTTIAIGNVKIKQEKWAGFISMDGEITYSSNKTDFEGIGPIGDFSLVIYDTDWTEDIRSAADEYSADGVEAFAQLGFGEIEGEHEQYNRINVHSRIVLLEKFTIYENYRSKGLGTLFMKELIWYLHTVMHVNYILLKSYPYQNDLPYSNEKIELTEEMIKENSQFVESKKAELSRFYKQFGYQNTGNISLNYMVLCVNKYINEKKDKYNLEIIEEQLFESYKLLKIPPGERKVWLELFQFSRNLDRDLILAGRNDEKFISNLLSYHFSNKKVRILKGWGGDKRKSLVIKLTPYFLYFFNNYLDFYRDFHWGTEGECSSLEINNCDICRFLDKYKTILENDSVCNHLINFGNDLMDTYKSLLSDEKVNKMYSELEKQIQMERLIFV